MEFSELNDSEFSELTDSSEEEFSELTDSEEELSELTDSEEEFSELTDSESEKTAFIQMHNDGVSKMIHAENEHKNTMRFRNWRILSQKQALTLFP